MTSISSPLAVAPSPDLAEAPAIHALLLTRLPKGTISPPAPGSTALGRLADADPVPEDVDPPRSDLARDPLLDAAVRDQAVNGRTAAALRLVSAAPGISPAYAAQLKADVAQVLLTRNEDAEALRVAQAALHQKVASDQPGLGFYIGGLAAWRLNRMGLAQVLFAAGARAANASPRLHAASAFWASRSSRALQDTVGTIRWLELAAEQRLTFHGMLARRLLHLDTDFFVHQELPAQADIDAVAATPQGWRAFALLQVGQLDHAEAELRALWVGMKASPAFRRSLMLVASAAGLTDCAAQMALLLQSEDGHPHNGLRFPLPRLRPAGGFSIDPAMVYALTRLESNFDPTAISKAGARGLMQIMPATAQYLIGEAFFAPERLHEPGSNLAIGQRYFAYLSRQDGINGDLIRTLVSYNSGPGNFARWGPDIRSHGDPLLFIEAIPVPETRAFVTHALVYAWIYAARLHLPAPSLDELAAGNFPRFTPHREERTMTMLTPGFH